MCSCKETIEKYTFSRCETIDVYIQPDEGARFEGELIHTSDEGVSDHGFAWDLHKYPTPEFSNKISLGPTDSVGKFLGFADKDLGMKELYYVRAYILEDDEYSYGHAIPFISLGSKALHN